MFDLCPNRSLVGDAGNDIVSSSVTGISAERDLEAFLNVFAPGLDCVQLNTSVTDDVDDYVQMKDVGDEATITGASCDF